MMDKVEKKRQKEQHVVEEMIRLYCRKKHPKEDRQAGQICPVCQELLDYARLRSEKCPFMKEKTFCANCKVHCYKPEVREQIRQVMRFSGPRMLLYNRKNLYRSGLGMPPVILLPSSENFKSERRITGRCRSGII